MLCSVSRLSDKCRDWSKSYCCFAKGRKLYCASERTASAASSGDYQQPVKCFPKICLMKRHWRWILFPTTWRSLHLCRNICPMLAFYWIQTWATQQNCSTPCCWTEQHFPKRTTGWMSAASSMWFSLFHHWAMLYDAAPWVLNVRCIHWKMLIWLSAEEVALLCPTASL